MKILVMTSNGQLYNIQYKIDGDQKFTVDSLNTGCINSFLFADPFCVKQAEVIPDWDILVLLSVQLSETDESTQQQGDSLLWKITFTAVDLYTGGIMGEYNYLRKDDGMPTSYFSINKDYSKNSQDEDLGFRYFYFDLSSTKLEEMRDEANEKVRLISMKIIKEFDGRPTTITKNLISFEILKDFDEVQKDVDTLFSIFYIGDKPHIFGLVDENQQNIEDYGSVIEVMSPDLRILEKTYTLQSMHESVACDMLHIFHHFGEGLVLVGYDVNYFVLDLQKKTLSHLMGHKVIDQMDSSEDKSDIYSNIRKERGLMYWYDIEGYILELVEQRKYLRQNSNLGKRQAPNRDDDQREKSLKDEQSKQKRKLKK